MGKQEGVSDLFQMAKDYAKAEMNRKRFGERPLFRFVIKGMRLKHAPVKMLSLNLNIKD